jgi:hypothetical protein
MGLKAGFAAALGLIVTTCAYAASHTLIGDYTGLDCATNRKTTVYAKPFNPEGKSEDAAGDIADQTPIHIFRGRQYGKPVAIPNTDAEFARIWFEAARIDDTGKPLKARFWLQSGFINCGG